MENINAKCWKCKYSLKCEKEKTIRDLRGQAHATSRKTGIVIELVVECDRYQKRV